MYNRKKISALYLKDKEIRITKILKRRIQLELEGFTL